MKGRPYPRLRLYLIFLPILLSSCATAAPKPQEGSFAAPADVDSAPGRDQGARAAAASVPVIEVQANVPGPLETMRELDAAAASAFDTNHPIEALRHLVALLAVDAEGTAETQIDRSLERTELARKADAALTAIGGRLTLEPGDAWLSAGAQVAGGLRDLAKGRGLLPAVRLVINYDHGKAVVADAPIRFTFVDGVGEVTEEATTDSYGLASATVRSLARTDRPAVIRATLVVSSRGSSRKFPEVFRDFTYLPTSRTARILASEKPAMEAEERVDPASPLVDAVSRGLEGAGLEIRSSTGTASAESYLVLAVTEYDEARQVVNRGRAFDIFTVTARTQVRILRGDGSVVVTRPELTSVGRGGTAEAALEAALAAARAATEKDLRESAARIAKALD